MTVFRVQVNYRTNSGGKWSNVYHMRGALIGDIRSNFESVGVPALRPFLHAANTLVSVLYSSDSDDTFISDTLELPGTSADTASQLPLFNCAKVLFSTSATGRPDYKFIKGWLTETLTEDGQIETATRNAMQTAFQDLLTDMASEDTPFVSESDDLWGIVSVQGPVQMRQLHRKRKKTVTP
jgi:hypothetical protein